MRILFASNFGTAQCGVAEFGRQHAHALVSAGHDVTSWDAQYPNYLPLENDGRWDILHLNWHGVTLGHIQPQHLTKGLPVSLYLHEVHYDGKNRERTPLWDYVQLRVAAQHTTEDSRVVEVPCPPSSPFAFCHIRPPQLGMSGIRAEGTDMAQEVCARNGWNWLPHPGGWFSTVDEVARLSKNTLNVALYGNAFGGQSLGVMFSIAAKRPLILTRNPMFESLYRYEDCLYFTAGGPPGLERTIKRVLADIDAGKAKYPTRITEERSWRNAVKCWESLWWEIV